MHEQIRLFCTIMRGGTSKAVFIKNNELPADPELRDKTILAIFGSPDVRQIDGLGGSDITTSKVAVIGPPTREDADVDYTFGQVQLNTAEIVWNANCGNISSAVGPYAIDEGMVKVSEPFTIVRIHNTNTGKVLVAKIQVKDGLAVVEGDYKLDGVPGTGAKIELDYALTAGASTGRLLPTGNPLDVLDVPGLGQVEASIVDIANTTCFIRPESVGATGLETPPEIRANRELLDKMEMVRQEAAIKCGFIKPGEIALEKSPIRPMISFVSEPRDYINYGTGEVISGEDMDFTARVLFNQMPTDTFPGTGTVCLATAAQIQGTVVNRIYSRHVQDKKLVRFGHARGVNIVVTQVDNGGPEPVAKKAVFNRTARRIMDGVVYVKRSRLV